MDKSQLSDKEVDILLGSLKPVEVKSAPTTYGSGSNVKEEYEKELDKAARVQELGHKEQLMQVVSYLAKESFKLLALIVVAQMVIRLIRPDYSGVSDDVVKVIAVSVFGQVIVIVGALATYLFRKK
jgi:hypothetical protein